ncbi:MAG: RcpC/CpaB family pilus assembly protein [Actinomycetota bacterium]
MRRKIVMVVAALLCGALGTALLVRFVQGAESRALEGEQLVEVFVVTEYIPSGTSGTAMIENGLVEVTEVPEKVRPVGSVISAADIADQVADTDLFPGEQLVVDRFINPDAFDSNPSAVQAPEGYIEISVSMPPQRVMGGFISPGDTVAIFASFNPGAGEGSSVDIDGIPVELPEELATELALPEETTHVLMHKVLVTEIQVEEVPVQPDPDDPRVANAPRLVPSGNMLLTLALTTPEAERLVFALEYGSLYMAQEPEDAPEEGTQIQTRETVYDSTEPAAAR